jgi:hypothetical protein
LRRLTSLRRFDNLILLCPRLEKRCEEGIGEEWPKIAQSPKIANYSSGFEVTN